MDSPKPQVNINMIKIRSADVINLLVEAINLFCACTNTCK